MGVRAQGMADAAGPPVSSAPAPALQVIVLGSGGGPLENNVTAFLVRSVASGWAKGSVVAVDAGVHLSAIKTILEKTQPASLGDSNGPLLPHTLTTGPFAGLQIPNATADANAAYVHRDLVETYLITHPHLDHIAGFVINTAGLSGSRPKRVAGLPSTINALKTHVFNNVIWPNLSDENNGAGLVTYTRLVDGGSPALGEGEGRGYLEICGGLAVKIWSISHGHCIERHSHRGSSSTRHGSFDASSGAPAPIMPSPSRGLAPHTSLPTNIAAILQQHERMQAATPASRRGSSFSGAPAVDESVCVYDSSVYFIRDMATGREILIFGDVEPDSVSLSPRNRQIWQEAAPKVASGNLAAIFIECSYDDSRCAERLFGHLTPRYINEEMTALAEEVVAVRQEREQRNLASQGASSIGGERKRKRIGEEGTLAKRASTPQLRASREPRPDVPVSPRSLNPRRRVSSTASSASDLDPHGGGADLPRSLLPLPAQTHPLRSATSAARQEQQQPILHAEPEDATLYADQQQQQQQPLPPPAQPHQLLIDPDLHGLGMPSPTAADLSPTTTTATTTTSTLTAAATPPPSTSGSTIPTSYPPTSYPQLAPASPTNLSTTTTATAPTSAGAVPSSLRNALAGLRVVVMHVKERMVDGPRAGEAILRELAGHEAVAGLGVSYGVSEAGEDFFF